MLRPRERLRNLPQAIQPGSNPQSQWSQQELYDLCYGSCFPSEDIKGLGWGSGWESPQGQVATLGFGPSDMTPKVILKPHSGPPPLWRSILRRGGWGCKSQILQREVVFLSPLSQPLGSNPNPGNTVLACKHEASERTLHGESQSLDPGSGVPFSLKSGRFAVGR